MAVANIHRYLDHAVLKPELTRAETIEAIQLGIDYKVKTVCVRPCDIETAVKMCRGTETEVSCVLSFPHGCGMSEVKAEEAKKYGLSVIVLGEQWSPGGQVYRAIEQTPPEILRILGPDYQEGQRVTRSFREPGVAYLDSASVWQVEPDRIVSFIFEGNARQIKGKHILIADTPEHFAQGVDKVLLHDELRKSLAHNGFELVKSDYSIETSKKEILNILDSICLKKY